jgi:hypothetical protein
MRLRIFSLCLLAAAALLAQPATSYRLNFSFHELENGKRLSTRNYSMLLEPNTFVKLNVGSKMPVPSNAGPNVQYSYIDVGVNLRARIQEQGPDLRLNAEIEMSNLGADKDVQNRPLPQIRQIRAEVDAILAPGRATPVVTLDDPAGPRQYEMEVTASRVK